MGDGPRIRATGVDHSGPVPATKAVKQRKGSLVQDTAETKLKEKEDAGGGPDNGIQPQASIPSTSGRGLKPMYPPADFVVVQGLKFTRTSVTRTGDKQEDERVTYSYQGAPKCRWDVSRDGIHNVVGVRYGDWSIERIDGEVKTPLVGSKEEMNAANGRSYYEVPIEMLKIVAKDVWTRELVDAVCMEEADRVACALRMGANPNAVCENGKPAILEAVSNMQDEKHGRIVKMLIDSGADPNTKMRDGVTALHIAAMMGYCEIINVLASHGKAKHDIRNDIGWAPIHVSVMFEQPEAVNTLIKLGSDVSLLAEDGSTPLMLATRAVSISEGAAREKLMDIILVLVHHGASIDDIDVRTGYRAISDELEQEIVQRKLIAPFTNDASGMMLVKKHGQMLIRKHRREK